MKSKTRTAPEGAAVTAVRLVGAVVLATLLIANAAPAAHAQQTDEQVSDLYQIAPLDTLEIDVFGEPELSRTAAVRPDGRLQLPVAGDIDAAGRTPAELARAIEAELTQFVQDPRVTVFVQDAQGSYDQRIRVIGLGTAPTSLVYRDGMTVTDVVTAIGGLPATAAGDDAYIWRGRGDDARRIPVDIDRLIGSGDVTADKAMAPGDVLVVPQGFFAGDWETTTGARASVTYTDNVDLDPDGQEDDALIFRAGPTFSIQGQSARLQGALDVALLGRQETLSDDDEGVELDANVSGTGTLEAVPDLFFVDASASVARLLVDADTPSSGTGANDTNRSTFQTYRLSPYVVNRLGSFARSTVRYTGTQTFSGSDAAADSLTHEANVTLEDGPTFGPLGWSLSGQASEEFRDDASDISQREVAASVSYAVSSQLELTGRVGFETFEETGENDVIIRDQEDPFWSVGFRYLPSPDTTISASIGERFGGETFSLDAQHAITPRTNVFARYNETVSTQQRRLGENLPQQGDQLDQFDPNPSAFDLDNTVTTTERFEVGANTELEGNRIGWTGFYTIQRQGIDTAGGADSEVIGTSLNVSRPLGPDWNLSTRGLFQQRDDSLDDETTEDIQVGASLSYSGFRSISVSLNYDFTTRLADEAANEFTENAITLQGSINF